jgi:hypothetical protein
MSAMSSRDNSLGAKHVQDYTLIVLKKNLKVLDDPLHDAEVIQDLHDRNEEDDSGELQQLWAGA